MDESSATLKAKATDVLSRLERKAADPTFRPTFIEFAGTPKSGKSTCIDILHHFFRRTGFKVLAPTEGASKRTPYYLKDNLFCYNTYTLSYALNHVLEGSYHSDKFQLAILDRGLFDSLVWMKLLEEDGKIDASTCQTMHAFATIGHWCDLVDCVFMFYADPATSLGRETKDKIIDEPGRAMNPDFLRRLNASYTAIRSEYAAKFDFYDLDTSDTRGTSPRQTAMQACEHILSILDKKCQES